MGEKTDSNWCRCLRSLIFVNSCMSGRAETGVRTSLCVRECVRACVRACVRVCVCVCVCVVR